MVSERLISHQELDLEWVELIWQALDMGLSEEEIRSFLDESNRTVTH